MPTSTFATRTEAARRRWDRFVQHVLPAPDADRLVRVAEVSRIALPHAEGSLAEAGISPVVQETRGMNGSSRFVVLVSARERHVAAEVLAGQ